MKSSPLIVVLVILIALLGGISVVVGINNTVQLSMAPVVDHLKQIEANQKVILEKLNGPNAGSDAQVLTRLSGIETQVNGIKTILTNILKPQAPQVPQEDFNKVYSIDIGSSPVHGKKDAPITIVEFTDFQCPFCARFYPPLKEVMKAYPDKVKVVIKNFPLSFHPNARPAAKLALAAQEQGKYFEIVDLLLENGASVSEDKVKEYAKTLKLNYNKLMSDLKAKDAEYEQKIVDDMKLGEQVDVQGTPTFFFNGKKTQSRDFNAFKQEIDQALAAK